MRNKLSKKHSARKLYAAMMSVEDIAEAMNTTERTIQTYKAEDRDGENDWDSLRAAKLLGKDPLEKTRLLDNFVAMMHGGINEINNDVVMKPGAKAKAIAELGGAYEKILRVARSEDPAAYRLATIKKTLFVLLENLRDKLDENSIAAIVEIINSADFKNEVIKNG